jgi:hypothetical protein
MARRWAFLRRMAGPEVCVRCYGPYGSGVDLKNCLAPHPVIAGPQQLHNDMSREIAPNPDPPSLPHHIDRDERREDFIHRIISIVMSDERISFPLSGLTTDL